MASRSGFDAFSWPILRLAAVAWIALCLPTTPLSATEAASALAPVTVAENGPAYILENSYVKVTIDKQTADVISFQYKGLEMFGGSSGHPHGYWSHTPNRSSKVVDTVTVDPKANQGQRGEVSIKTHGTGGSTRGGFGGGTAGDIEIRYSLGREDSGIYTYSVFEHKEGDPATQIGEARFAAKLTPGIFDYMTIDARRHRIMPKPADWDAGIQLNMKEARRLTTGLYKGEVEHKYDYTADQFDTPTFGWSSTERKAGLWFVNPSNEYLSGGPTKFELMAHLDGSEGGGAAPTILNYWRSSHYGGSVCVIGEGEAWTKVIGPFLIYCNSAPDQDALWKDALEKTKREAEAWPYQWVMGVDYPHKDQRGSATGKIALKDPQAPTAKLSHLRVGLAAPAYTIKDRRGELPVEWQNDAKHYEFWVRGDDEGRFTIPNVRPGRYTLYAIADGVLGEYVKNDITVEAGKALDLTELVWTPVRYGRQLWEIGIPNRNASEFFKGDDYWHWGMYLRYATYFPKDIQYIVGKSEFQKDWYIYHVPRVNGSTDGRGEGSSTAWTITFDLPEAPQGRAILRLALCGISAKSLAVSVNEKPAGTVTGLIYNATINRDGIQGSWVEKDVSFDGSLMRAGTNVIKLQIPAGGPTTGLVYDYLRLELVDGNER